MKLTFIFILIAFIVIGCGESDKTTEDGKSDTKDANTMPSDSQTSTPDMQKFSSFRGFHASGIGDAKNGMTIILLDTDGNTFTCNQEEDGSYIFFFVNGDTSGSYAHFSGIMEQMPAMQFQAVLQDITGGNHLNKKSSQSGTLKFQNNSTEQTLVGSFTLSFENGASFSGIFSTTSCDIDL